MSAAPCAEPCNIEVADNHAQHEIEDPRGEEEPHVLQKSAAGNQPGACIQNCLLRDKGNEKGRDQCGERIPPNKMLQKWVQQIKLDHDHNKVQVRCCSSVKESLPQTCEAFPPVKLQPVNATPDKIGNQYFDKPGLEEFQIGIRRSAESEGNTGKKNEKGHGKADQLIEKKSQIHTGNRQIGCGINKGTGHMNYNNAEHGNGANIIQFNLSFVGWHNLPPQWCCAYYTTFYQKWK